MTNPALVKTTRIIALVILLGVAVYLGVLYAAGGSAGLKEQLSLVSPVHFFVPIGLSLLSFSLRFLRWRFILHRLGHRLPVKTDIIFYLSGFALTMTPGKSGETIRSAFLLQASVPLPLSLAAFVVERGFDFLVVGLLATLLVWSPFVALALMFGILLVIALCGARLAYIEQLAVKLRAPALILRLCASLSQASAALHWRALVFYALLGSLAWSAQGVSFYFIVCIFTQQITSLSAISIYCAGLFAGAASLIPGGIGVTEGSLAWLLQHQGLEQNAAIVAALMSRLCTLWLAVAIGCAALVFIIKGGLLSPVVSKNTPKEPLIN